MSGAPANRLAQETSPYLQQHAHNPVDWYPWGEEALTRAREEDRPILLSVGYSACHWCHVMERESFENASIAAVMNDLFVNIKVDREERPDVDEIYMTAVQAMTGQGGWPMTVFLTPELRPFYGGTYYPPDDRHGRPGFGRVLQAVSEHFANQRERVEEQADKLSGFLEQNADPLTNNDDDLRGDRGHDLLQASAQALIQQHDERFGGFRQDGPKFPNSAGLSLLLRHWHSSGDAAALHVATHTLRQMARGGIFDHLGGGFHRYSVDERWLVPHFEKMLYDNALLVPVYVDAWQVTHEPLFSSVVTETLDYVIREMSVTGGGYAAAQDADTEGEEGKFFVWTPEQVEEAIDDDDASRLFCAFYDVTPHGNFEGHSILHVEEPVSEQARLLGVDEPHLQQVLASGRQALFSARSWREAPGRDDKVVVSWNGMMLSAMSRGAQALGRTEWLESALACGQFLQQNLMVDGLLRHSWKDGVVGTQAFQDDYAALICGLVDLYEASLEERWLQWAVELADGMIATFWDDARGGFFFADGGRTDLIVRTKNAFDGATPAGNSMAALGLLRLSALTGQARFADRAEATLQAYAGLLANAPSACQHMACALHQYREGPLEVSVVGESESRAALLRTTHDHYLPNRVLSGTSDGSAAADIVPCLRDRQAGPDGVARAWVCRDFTCSAPVVDVAELTALLRQSVREPS